MQRFWRYIFPFLFLFSAQSNAEVHLHHLMNAYSVNVWEGVEKQRKQEMQQQLQNAQILQMQAQQRYIEALTKQLEQQNIEQQKLGLTNAGQ